MGRHQEEETEIKPFSDEPESNAGHRAKKKTQQAKNLTWKIYVRPSLFCLEENMPRCDTIFSKGYMYSKEPAAFRVMHKHKWTQQQHTHSFGVKKKNPEVKIVST